MTHHLYSNISDVVTRILLLLILCSGCISTSIRENRAQLHLTTTILPTASLVKSIGDSLVSLNVLLPKGNTPEHYEPSPKDIQLLAQSDAYLYVGDLGFESMWMKTIQELNPNLDLIDLSEGLEAIVCLEDEHTERNHTHAHDYENDPHYWTGIRGIRHMATRIYEALSNLDSSQIDTYRKGFNRLSVEIDSLDREVRRRLDTLSSRAFVIYHPSLSDFALEFGLEQLVIEQNGKEPSVQQLKSLIDKARQKNVQVVFIQQEFNPYIAQSIAKELGAKEVEINPLDSDWKSQLVNIVNALAM